MSNKTTHLNSRNGFTLVELLVVIAIIGLLASVVLVALGQSRQKAEVAKAKSDFRSIGHSLELYRQAHGALPQAPSGITVPDLIRTYLGDYMTEIPIMPDRLIVSPNVYYYTNPTTADEYYNCGTPSGNQEYFVTFLASQAAIDDLEFPLLYTRGGTETGDPERCIDVEPN